MELKKGIKAALGKLGYEIRRIPRAGDFESTALGEDPFRDMHRLVSARDRPVVFDVRANIGQTVCKVREHFSAPSIHAFEPGPDAFAELQRNTRGTPDLWLNNFALGSRSGALPLFRNSVGSPLNSLLEKGPVSPGETSGVDQVPVLTLDAYCAKSAVTHIDILKTDTLGFDLEVIRGGQEMISRRAVQLIYMEIIFSIMYRGLPRLDEIYAYLADHGFELVSFYKLYYWGERASWTDALFIHPQFSSQGSAT